MILKNFWKDNDRFADLFNACLFGGKQILKPEDLTEVDPDFSTLVKLNNHAETLQKVLDVVKKTDHGVDFVILGIENQQKTQKQRIGKIQMNFCQNLKNQTDCIQ